MLSICFNLLKGSRDFIALTCCFVCFPNAFAKGEYSNLVCSIICLWVKDNISSPGRYSYLSMFPDYNADIFPASLLILHCSPSFLILSSIVMTSFYVLPKWLVLKRERLSGARVASITKKEYGFAVHFLYRFTKSWNSISDKWLNAICLSFYLFKIFIIK